jgi:hypothetical protein
VCRVKKHNFQSGFAYVNPKKVFLSLACSKKDEHFQLFRACVKILLCVVFWVLKNCLLNASFSLIWTLFSSFDCLFNFSASPVWSIETGSSGFFLCVIEKSWSMTSFYQKNKFLFVSTRQVKFLAPSSPWAPRRESSLSRRPWMPRVYLSWPADTSHPRDNKPQHQIPKTITTSH